MRLPSVRADTLPEGIDYKDTGCVESPSCLKCPLPECVYDTPTKRVRGHVAVWERDQRIFELRKNGVPVPELARAFKLSARQVLRSIQMHDRPRPVPRDNANWNVEDEPGKPVSEIGKGFKMQKPRLMA